MPFHTPGDLPDPGIELVSLGSPTLTGRFFTTSTIKLQYSCRQKECLLVASQGVYEWG